MRIGIVTTWFDRGGGMVSRAYWDVLSKKHQVFIYGRGGEYYPKGDPNWDFPEVTWGKHFRPDSTRIHWPHFLRWFKKVQPEVLFFNEQSSWIPVVLARRLLPVSLGAYIDYYKGNTVDYFNLYDFLICNTRRHYSVFQNHRSCLYVPWGANCDVFTGDCLPVDEKHLVFFHSAGMSPNRKGTLTALQAFQQVTGPCRFLLHCQAPLSNYPAIQEICERDLRIEVVNETVHAPGLYYRGDVYVYPTLLDGIGLTIAEALASGLPVIVPDVAPMNEFVKDGETGRLVQPNEFRGRSDGYYWPECHCRPEDFTVAMQYYVDNRADLPAMKTRAQQQARSLHNWKKNAASLPEEFEKLRDAYLHRTDLSALERQALSTSDTNGPVRRFLRDGFRALRMEHTRLAERILYRL